MSERDDRFIKCLACFGIDKETQERLEGRAPIPDCHLCQGTGGLEVTFKSGLESNEVRTIGKIGKSGYPIIEIQDEYNK